ncbi:hypothetical protein [Xanthomonas campestris]|uniref:hypothetical protein n=1 Tax=Xanthomonas campestris TaxID=339 RepID=UPI000E31181F|nr:hypothetical protein [Xanthomonas campestris]MCF8799240.1 hypothetical protein [Xanthomonas campestris pv. campestris]MCF8812182.1 hypothetical protein [Xanthomonas campestris pv. campestris]MEA9569630.1 hypothetical protein [Xanthomonas campestris]MEA9627455.1 hypothetical protein [Xanthomonas campestris]MEA9630860.1 hypothetical protein [Xanthomonas campestris]
MTRALKRWWVYLAAVPLADGKSAFRLGRSVDMVTTVQQLQEGSPLRVTRVWALPTCSERAACAAVAGLQSDLSAYRDHDAWLHMRTDQDSDKAAMRLAMQAAGQYAEGAADANGPCWRTLNMDG